MEPWIGTKTAQLYFRPAIWGASKTPVTEVGESEECVVDRFDAINSWRGPFPGYGPLHGPAEHNSVIG